MTYIPKKIMLAGFLAAVSLVAACKKHQDDPAPGATTPAYKSASDYIQKNQVKSQYFTMDATAGGTVKGAKGTELTFPAKAFKDQAGNVVTGNVKIEIKEVQSPKDMLFSGVLPVSNGKPLVSGGELYVRVTQESSGRTAADSVALEANELQLGDTMSFVVRVPVDTVISSMRLFQGEEYTDSINWVVLQNQGRWTNSVGSFTSPYTGYFFTCHTLHWINVDSFLDGVVNSNQWGSITCVLPEGFTETSTNLYIYYNGLNAIFPINRFNNSLTSSEVMQGMDITIVGIGTDVKGNLYSVFKPVKITGSNTVQLTLTPCTDDEFKTQMDALN